MRKYFTYIMGLAFIFCFSITTKTFGQCTNAPVINSFSPVTGFIGSTVTINGAFFDPTPANNQVWFGATQATVLTASFGVLTVTVPVGATTAPISVKNNCNLTAYSRVSFNGIFCPTPLTATTYSNTAFNLPGVYGAYNMLSQDMDMDGKPDIVCAGQGGGVTIARNNSTPGNLNFTAFNFTLGGSSVAVADFDGDGKRDLYQPGHVRRNTSVPGTPSFAAAVGVGTGGYQCAAGDINNDGKIDIISGSGSSVLIAFNTSSGPGNISFGAAVSVNVGGHCTGLQMADVDGDGKTDILATQGPQNRAVTLRNTTTAGSFTATFEAFEVWSTGGNYPYRCQIADFDKDGKIDLTTVNFSNPSNNANTAVLRNTSVVGDISFAAPNTFPGPQNNYRVGVGDVNGDGFPDIVTKSLAVVQFAVYTNTSSGAGNIAFAPRSDYPAAAAEVSGIAIGDLDGDYVPDIATSGTRSNAIRFHRNTSVQVDITNPTALCKNIIVALSPSGTVNVTASMINNGSSDACGIGQLLINGQASINFTCTDIGENNVTLTVIDNSNNEATCTATVTVAPAAIIVAGQTTVCQGQTVLLTANLGDSYQWYKDGNIIGGATNQTYTASTTGAYTVAVTNAGGCSGTSAPTVVTVNNNPTVNVTPSGTTFLCPPGNNALLTASLSSTYQWKLNGTNIPNATQQTYTATAAGSYTVQVLDLFGCSATSDAVVVANTQTEIDIWGNGVSIVDGDNSPSTADHTDFETTFPSTSVVKTYTINNAGPTGALTVNSISMTGAQASNYTVGGITLPATIAAGNSATFTVTFLGTSIQVYNAEVVVNNNDCNEAVYNYAVRAEISCVAASFSACPNNNIITNTDAGLCSAVVTYTATATGTPTPTITHQFSGATEHPAGTPGTGSGSSFNKGVTNVVITASNGCGNNATCSFTVTVNDNELPAITCPANITLSACVSTATWSAPVGNDNCSGWTVTQTAGPASGSTFANGTTTTITYKATDAAGNTATCSFTVSRAATLGATITTNNQYLFFGYTGDQTATITATPTGGTAPYTVKITMVNGATPAVAPAAQRVNGQLICNFINAAGDEIWTPGANTNSLLSTSITCAAPITGPASSTSNAINSGSYSVNVTLLADARFIATVTDANGCVFVTPFEDAARVDAEDVRCFAGNSGNVKVKICHRTASATNPCVTICVDESAVAEHLSIHGDFLGKCTPGCVAPAGNAGLGTVTGDVSAEVTEFETFNVRAIPNPSEHQFTLYIEGGTNEKVQIVVYDVLGRQVKKIERGDASGAIKFGEDLKVGAYFVEIRQGVNRKTIKLVKQ